MPDMYTRHKPIRNKIKTYAPLSIITMCIDTLHSKVDPFPPLEWKGYIPWDLLLLIRWVFEYMDPNKQRMITKNEFISLLNDIRDLRTSPLLEQQKEERILDAFLRRGLFFQLPFQLHVHEILSSVGRQLVMFEDLGSQYNLTSTFQNITGLDLKEFFNIYLACSAGCISGDALKLSIPYFQKQFSENMMRSFFSTVALTVPKAKKYIREHTSKNSTRQWIDYQINEHTPLERCPFLELNGFFIPYSTKLMDNGVMYNVYDIFKENNPNFSRDSFGNIFENYVAKGVEYASAKYLREKQIKPLLPKGSKTADILIREDQAAILIDAKSTELHPIARVLQSKEAVLTNTESTIIHGVIQIIETAHHLSKTNHINKAQPIYGIVVTYKNYLIGDGKRFWEDIIGDVVEEKLREQGIVNLIPPENLFFVSIEEFDFLIAGAKERKLSISEILMGISERNESSSTTCLMVKQHLRSMWGQNYSPKYVEDRIDQCFKELIDKSLHDNKNY